MQNAIYLSRSSYPRLSRGVMMSPRIACGASYCYRKSPRLLFEVVPGVLSPASYDTYHKRISSNSVRPRKRKLALTYPTNFSRTTSFALSDACSIHRLLIPILCVRNCGMALPRADPMLTRSKYNEFRGEATSREVRPGALTQGDSESHARRKRSLSKRPFFSSEHASTPDQS